MHLVSFEAKSRIIWIWISHHLKLNLTSFDANMSRSSTRPCVLTESSSINRINTTSFNWLFSLVMQKINSNLLYCLILVYLLHANIHKLAVVLTMNKSYSSWHAWNSCLLPYWIIQKLAISLVIFFLINENQTGIPSHVTKYPSN